MQLGQAGESLPLKPPCRRYFRIPTPSDNLDRFYSSLAACIWCICLTLPLCSCMMEWNEPLHNISRLAYARVTRPAAGAAVVPQDSAEFCVLLPQLVDLPYPSPPLTDLPFSSLGLWCFLGVRRCYRGARHAFGGILQGLDPHHAAPPR